MFNQYPYINLNDLNLDYILKAIKEMRYEVTNFVSINAIKYADPIQWNITSQYEKNTIVIDPQTGTAYISVAAVPAGVALTRPEYWTVVFDLGSFVTRAAQNFTSRWESETTLTATFPTNAGEWLVWGDTLYIANVNITAGDSYVVNGNIRRITVEEVKNTIMQLIADNYDALIAMIGDLNDLTTTEKNNIVGAINELVVGLSDEARDRQDADDNLQNAIDGEVRDRQDADDNLQNAIDGEVRDRQDADDTINTKIGDLVDLQTTDKTSIVNAINELVNQPDSALYNVKDFGAIGDGITDDSAAINSTITLASNDGGGTVVFPAGTYKCDSIIYAKSNVNLIGLGGATLDCSVAERTSIAANMRVAVAVAGAPSSPISISGVSVNSPNIIVPDGSIFSVGDLIEVYSTSQRYNYQTTGDGGYYGALAIINKIAGNTLTVTSALNVTITTDCYIRKVNPIHDVIISGLHVIGSNIAGYQCHGIYVIHGRNVIVENCNIEGFDLYNIGVVSTYNAKILNNDINGTFYDGITGTTFYGVAVMNDSYSILVDGNSARNVRHLFVNSAYTIPDFVYGAPTKIIISNNLAIGMMFADGGLSYAYEHHGTGTDIVFNSNIADSCYNGFNIEGVRVLVSNNIIRNFAHCGIAIGDAYSISDLTITGNDIGNYIGDTPLTTDAFICVDGSTGLGVQRVNINNNKIIVNKNTMPAIKFVGTVNRCTIHGNYIEYSQAGSASSPYAIYNLSTAVMNDITANTIKSNPFGIYSTGATVAHNDIYSADTTNGYGIRCAVVSGTGVILGNILHGSSTGIYRAGTYAIVSNAIIDAPTTIGGSGTYTGVGNYPITLNT